MIKKLKNWLGGDPSDVLFVSGEDRMTRGEIRGNVMRLAALLEKSAETRVLISETDPVRFASEFLSVLFSGKTPVLSGGHPKEVLAGHFGFAFPEWTFERGAMAPEPAFKPDDPAEFFLFTSGSTGRPKPVCRTVGQMDREAEATALLFGDLIRGSAVCTTVDPIHLYGLSFTVWLPMALGVPREARRITVPEDFRTAPERMSLITTPSFLRYLDPGIPAPHTSFVLSAGGALPWAAADLARSWCGAPVHEIYGTTETGAIGWRKTDRENKPANLVPGVKFSGEPAGSEITSPFVPGGRASLDDRIEILPDGSFMILGRRDRIVKIAEERISLSEVERRCKEELGLSVRTVALDFSGRTVLGAVAEGQTETFFPRERTEEFRKKLARVLKRQAVPKLWRGCRRFPENNQGKIEYAALRALFEKRDV